MKICKQCLTLIIFVSVTTYLAGASTVFILKSDIVAGIDKLYEVSNGR